MQINKSEIAKLISALVKEKGYIGLHGIADISDLYNEFSNMTKEEKAKNILKVGLINARKSSINQTVKVFGSSWELRNHEQEINEYRFNSPSGDETIMIVSIPKTFKDSLGHIYYCGTKKYAYDEREAAECISDDIFKGKIPSEMILGYYSYNLKSNTVNFEENPRYYERLSQEEKDRFINENIVNYPFSIDIKDEEKIKELWESKTKIPMPSHLINTLNQLFHDYDFPQFMKMESDKIDEEFKKIVKERDEKRTLENENNKDIFCYLPVKINSDGSIVFPTFAGWFITQDLIDKKSGYFKKINDAFISKDLRGNIKLSLNKMKKENMKFNDLVPFDCGSIHIKFIQDFGYYNLSDYNTIDIPINENLETSLQDFYSAKKEGVIGVKVNEEKNIFLSFKQKEEKKVQKSIENDTPKTSLTSKKEAQSFSQELSKDEAFDVCRVSYIKLDKYLDTLPKLDTIGNLDILSKITRSEDEIKELYSLKLEALKNAGLEDLSIANMPLMLQNHSQDWGYQSRDNSYKDAIMLLQKYSYTACNFDEQNFNLKVLGKLYLGKKEGKDCNIMVEKDIPKEMMNSIKNELFSTINSNQKSRNELTFSEKYAILQEIIKKYHLADTIAFDQGSLVTDWSNYLQDFNKRTGLSIQDVNTNWLYSGYEVYDNRARQDNKTITIEEQQLEKASKYIVFGNIINGKININKLEAQCYESRNVLSGEWDKSPVEIDDFKRFKNDDGKTQYLEFYKSTGLPRKDIVALKAHLQQFADQQGMVDLNVLNDYIPANTRYKYTFLDASEELYNKIGEQGLGEPLRIPIASEYEAKLSNRKKILKQFTNGYRYAEMEFNGRKNWRLPSATNQRLIDVINHIKSLNEELMTQLNKNGITIEQPTRPILTDITSCEQYLYQLRNANIVLKNQVESLYEVNNANLSFENQDSSFTR